MGWDPPDRVPATPELEPRRPWWRTAVRVTLIVVVCAAALYLPLTLLSNWFA